MPTIVDAPIVAHREVAPRHFVLTLHAPPIAASAQPGQFVQVRGADWIAPLLPRPFSVMRAYPEQGNIEILYRVVGKGTAKMAGWRVGEVVAVVGPLGNAFRIANAGRQILVCGGVGVPPMVMLAKRLRSPILVLQGARTAEQILCEGDFRQLGVEVLLATDDGSRGHHGLVTELLEQALDGSIAPCRCSTGTSQTPTRGYPMVYTCGPHPMMREVARICREHSAPCQAALEAPMPCGFGVCMGCVVKTINGYRRVCKEGPVFDAKEVVWDE